MQDPALTESSGLAVSGRHPDVLWTHDDGGSVAQVVAARLPRPVRSPPSRWPASTPTTRRRWPPASAGSGRAELYLGDIGDNRRSRPDVSVFRFPEPTTLRDTTVEPQWYRFTYPDGPHDAEALLVGPGGRIMIATKAFSGAGLYRAPKQARDRRPGHQPADRAGRGADAGHRRRVPAGRAVRAAHLQLGLRATTGPGHEVARALRCRCSRRGSRSPPTATGCWSAARACTPRCSRCRCPAARRPSHPTPSARGDTARSTRDGRRRRCGGWPATRWARRGRRSLLRRARPSRCVRRRRG